MVSIDLRKHPEKTKEFGVSIVPTKLIYDRSDKEKVRHMGSLAKPFMVNILDDLLTDGTSQATQP